MTLLKLALLLAFSVAFKTASAEVKVFVTNQGSKENDEAAIEAVTKMYKDTLQKFEKKIIKK